ncbi:TPA: hypothetical protein DCX15_04420 [bacterium]|nr:hypothetical protein [bacterium]
MKDRDKEGGERMRGQIRDSKRQEAKERGWVDEEKEVFKRLKEGFYRLPIEDKKEVVEYIEFLREIR